MAEVIGLIASTMTIAAGVLKGIRVVKTCYRASKELEALQVGDSLYLLLPLVNQIETQKDC